MNHQPDWSANAVPVEAKAQLYKQTLSFDEEERRARRRVGRLGFAVGCVGLAIGLMSVTAVAVILPLKQTVVKFVEVDTATGWVGEATGAMDAPKFFSERVAMAYLRRYIEAREGFAAQRDHAQWEFVKALTSGLEFDRYIAERKRPDAPKNAIGQNGVVDVYNFSLAARPSKSPDGTWTYLVNYRRREVRGITAGPERAWVAQIDFQWHPEMTMSTPDSQLNEAGMQVLSYRAEIAQ